MEALQCMCALRSVQSRARFDAVLWQFVVSYYYLRERDSMKICFYYSINYPHSKKNALFASNYRQRSAPVQVRLVYGMIIPEKIIRRYNPAAFLPFVPSPFIMTCVVSKVLLIVHDYSMLRLLQAPMRECSFLSILRSASLNCEARSPLLLDTGLVSQKCRISDNLLTLKGG